MQLISTMQGYGHDSLSLQSPWEINDKGVRHYDCWVDDDQDWELSRVLEVVMSKGKIMTSGYTVKLLGNAKGFSRELYYRDAKKKSSSEEFLREVEKEGRRLGKELTVEELHNLRQS